MQVTYTHTCRQSHTLQSSTQCVDLCSSIARQVGLPDESKGCVNSVDTHHQSQIACGHNDYLLYVNWAIRQVIPLWDAIVIIVDRRSQASATGNLLATDYVPLKQDGKIGKCCYRGAEATQIFGQCKWWLCFLSDVFSERAKVWHCWVNNWSSVGKHITGNYPRCIFTRIQSAIQQAWHLVCCILCRSF